MKGPAPRVTPAAAACALCAAVFLWAPAATAQQVVVGASEIAFTSRQMGVPVDGLFRRWAAAMQFDPRKPESGKVSFSIDMGSASLGAADTDAEVAKAEWFNTARFPQAQFNSTLIKALGKGRFEVSGLLSIKGTTLPVTVPVALSQTGGAGALRTTATGTLVIKRLSFKIGEGAWSDTSMVADEVQVRFRLVLSGMAPL